MRGLPHAERYSDLLVYQKVRELQREVFQVTAAFPREETYSLTSQIRRSSRSIGAQIAEAWGKRRYEAHFVAKLTDADSEQYETRHWIATAADCGYLDAKIGEELTSRCEVIGRLLGGMIDKAALFCDTPGRAMREDMADYFTSNSD